MIAITTSNSIKVNPRFRSDRVFIETLLVIKKLRNKKEETKHQPRLNPPATRPFEAGSTRISNVAEEQNRSRRNETKHRRCHGNCSFARQPGDCRSEPEQCRMSRRVLWSPSQITKFAPWKFASKTRVAALSCHPFIPAASMSSLPSLLRNSHIKKASFPRYNVES